MTLPRYSTLPFGGDPVHVAYRGEAIALVATGEESAFLARATAAFGAPPPRDPAPPQGVALRLARALMDEADDDGPVDLAWMTPFQRRVLEIVRSIPRGAVRSYGWVAETAGYPRAARAVGSTLAGNALGPLVPCHRVRRADGSAAPWPGPGATAARDDRLTREGADLELLAWLHKQGSSAS